MREVITNYDNGKVKEKYFIDVNGKMEGEYILYYENGNIYEKYNYHDDKLEGETICYYKIGNVHEKRNYYDDKKEGEYIWYYENGNIQYKCTYHDDKKEGEYFEYNERNQLIKHRMYKNGCVTKYLLGEYNDGVITLINNEVKKEDDYCLICRDEKDDKELVKLSCGHIYHKKCLIQWMEQIKKELCPMCQQKIDWSKASNL